MSKINIIKKIPYTFDDYVPEEADKKEGKSVPYELKLPNNYDSFHKDLTAKIEAAEAEEKDVLKVYEGAIKDAMGGKDPQVWLANILALCKVLNDGGSCGDWTADEKKACKLLRDIAKPLKTKVLKDPAKLKMADDQIEAMHAVLESVATQFKATGEDLELDWEPKSRQNSNSSNKSS